VMGYPVFDCGCIIVHVVSGCRRHHTTFCCEFDHFGNAVLHDFFERLICFWVGLGIVNNGFVGFHMVAIWHEYVRNRRS
jgi:hypothetical protein